MKEPNNFMKGLLGVSLGIILAGVIQAQYGNQAIASPLKTKFGVITEESPTIKKITRVSVHKSLNPKLAQLKDEIALIIDYERGVRAFNNGFTSDYELVAVVLINRLEFYFRKNKGKSSKEALYHLAKEWNANQDKDYWSIKKTVEGRKDKDRCLINLECKEMIYSVIDNAISLNFKTKIGLIMWNKEITEFSNTKNRPSYYKNDKGIMNTWVILNESDGVFYKTHVARYKKYFP